MRAGSALLFSLFFVVFAGGSTCTAEDLLSATFDNKTPNQAIGVGGASEGEPVSVDSYITAIVRNAPMPTPCLEIQDSHNTYAGAATFHLLDDVEVTQGSISISMELWFDELEDFAVAIHESFGTSKRFATVSFTNTGAVELSDASQAYGALGSYTTDRIHRLNLIFDVGAGTYAMFLDGTTLISSGRHGITGRGIGSVLVGTDYDSDLVGKMYVDSIRVVRLSSGCTPSGSVLCLNDGRFKVSAIYRTPQGTSGEDAHATALTDDTGYFWFFDADNVEVVVKILDGCSFNQRYWVFAAGMTNVEVTLTVEDTALHVTKEYTNPLRTPFEPIQDTNAFATCQ